MTRFSILREMLLLILVILLSIYLYDLSFTWMNLPSDVNVVSGACLFGIVLFGNVAFFVRLIARLMA